MPQLLLIHEDKRLLRDESYLQHVSETYGIEVHQIAWEDDTPALKALFDSIVAQQPPLLWVLFLSFRVTPFQDFEGPFLAHEGPPFVIPMLLGTNQFEAIFSEKFQSWWHEHWEIVLRQNTPAFEGFWRVPGVPVGIISEPFRSERDFDGYLFPWIKRWDLELDSAKLFGTEHRLLEQWKKAERKPKRDSKRLYALVGGAVLIAGSAGIFYGQRHGKLLEAIFIVAAVVMYLITFALVRSAFSRSKGYLHLNSKGERRSASAYEHGRLARILSSFAALVLLILAGVFLVMSFGRLRASASATLNSSPIGIANKTETISSPTLAPASATTSAIIAPITEEVTDSVTSAQMNITQPTSSLTSTPSSTATPTWSQTPPLNVTSPRATATPTRVVPAFAATNTKTSSAITG